MIECQSLIHKAASIQEEEEGDGKECLFEFKFEFEFVASIVEVQY